MYSTCLFCNNRFEANDVLEAFPIGRRIAFDSAQGRLWVVCRSCERWNLSPLEERWEVIEECERLFSSTRMRVSTENIGLARLREGLELVRIGRPMRPEFAAWRYGDQFGRRRRRNMMRVGVGVGAAGLLLGGMWTAGIAFAGGINMGVNVFRPLVYGSPNKVVARIPLEGAPLKVKRKHLRNLRILSDGDRWRLQLSTRRNTTTFEGEQAQRVTALLLPHVNRSGGTKAAINNAVDLLDVAGDPLYYVASVARRNDASGLIQKMPSAVRLALEMASHEDAERRALEGELKALEIAWQEAEDVAAISDSLLLPQSVRDAIDRFKRG